MLKPMRHFLFVFLLAFSMPGFAAATVCAPPLKLPTPEMTQAAIRNARDHGFLWRISKDGHTSYLYGTIHVAKFEWMFPGPLVMKALQQSDTVALEMDLLDEDIRSRMFEAMQMMRRIVLPAALAKRMQLQSEAVCIPYASIANLAPELQVTTLTMMMGHQDGLEGEYALDAALAVIGHKEKKNMVSLETPEMQLQILEMENPQETIAFVEDSLDELESGRSFSMLKRISWLWADSDYGEMDKFETWCECLNTENERELMKRALDDRNPVLAENIDALHKSGKQVFAAVGSLHMFGPVGLPGLLQKRGYKVERIAFK